MAIKITEQRGLLTATLHAVDRFIIIKEMTSSWSEANSIRLTKRQMTALRDHFDRQIKKEK